MTQNQKMRDFVKSLENNQFSKEQEASCLSERPTLYRLEATASVKTGPLRVI